VKYGTSVRVRHIVGRLEKGEELVEGIRRLCLREKVRAGSFHGLGFFSSVELQELVPGGQKYASWFCAETPLEVLGLHGNVSTLGGEIIVNASAILGYAGHGQHHTVGGHISAARVHAFEFCFTAYDDLLLERTYDASTGLPLWNRIGASDLAAMSTPEAPLQRGQADASSVEPLLAVGETERTPAEGLEALPPKREPTVIRRGRVRRDSEEGHAAERSPTEPLPALQLAEKAAVEVVEVPVAASPAVAVPAVAASSVRSKEEWQKAAARAQSVQVTPSSRAVLDDDDEDDEGVAEIPIVAGDILDHPTLGECRVARVEDEDWAYIKVGTGKIRKLALQLFEIIPDGEHDGRKRYKLRKRRER